MDRDRRFDSVFSKKLNAGRRRTYFFDVRQTKGDDFYLTLTESTKRFDGEGHDRHKIFLYKEDFNRFLANLEEVINYVKTELMPDFDYEEFERPQEEWESRDAEQGNERPPRKQRFSKDASSRQGDGQKIDEDPGQWRKPTPPPSPKEQQFDDDLSW